MRAAGGLRRADRGFLLLDNGERLRENADGTAQENAPVWKKQGIQERINEEEASLQRYTVRERWTIAPKTIELYQQTILPMSYLRRPGILADSDAFSALVSQVHQGEISLEEFVEKADKLIEGLEQ